MFHFDRTASCVRQDTQKRKTIKWKDGYNNMKRKLIVTLAVAAIVAIALAPAAFAAPANCPLKNLVSGNNANLSQILGNSGQPALPDTGALKGLLNGAKPTSSCPKTQALQNLLNGTNTGTAATPASLQDLLSKLGINQSACQQQNNCTSANCPTGNCQSGNCLTAGCTAGTCPNK
jgi:outer membrane usher protein FimD/PapC